MISARGVARAGLVGAMVLLAVGGAGFGQTHAPWPTDWSNWSDPALWVTVGNPGNAGELSGSGAGGYGPNRICGAVGYTFNLGKFEVTAGQYTAFLNAVAKTGTYTLYDPVMYTGCNINQTGSWGTFTYSVPSDWANRPVNYVSWGSAARFANWLTNGQPTGDQSPTTTEDGSYYLNGAKYWDTLIAVTRIADGARTPGKKYYFIPTEDEWYKAAYHKNDGVTGNYFDYPTGSDSLPSNDLVDPDPGNNANFTVSWPDDTTIGSPYYRTVVGDFENSESPYGTFDQGGNVGEWNEAILYGFYRGLRGGTYYDAGLGKDLDLQASYGGTAGIPDYRYYNFGFRVSEVPEPASMALLALGGVGMLIRRRGMGR